MNLCQTTARCLRHSHSTISTVTTTHRHRLPLRHFHRTTILRPLASSATAYTPHSNNGNGNGSNQSQPELKTAFTMPTQAHVAPLPPTPNAATMTEVMPYLGKLALGESNLYWRLAAALILLLTSKATGLLAPIYFKNAVDALTIGNIATAAQSQTAMTAAVAALLLSGLCRGASGLSKELQHPLFTPVSQAAGRRVSFYVLAHVLQLDMQFHLDRQTGALSRMLERGARSIAMIFRAVVFTLVPTALELIAVCILLARSFHPKVSALVVATFVAYSAWTVGLTMAATRVRREVKDLDNAITSRAVDALLNVEAVKLCGNERLEVQLYDESLVRYQKASVKLEGTSATLNAGQAVVLATGMTAALAAAASTRGVTPGDLVMIQGLLLQLWAPLQFLGWFYRELRQSLVDMEDLFELMRMTSRVPNGSRDLPTQPQLLKQQHAKESTTYRRSSSSSGSGSGTHQQTVTDKEERVASHATATTSTTSTTITSNTRPGLRVELNNVRYRYPGTTRDVLRGVTITANPGESIAVVGPSGSGKSTLLRLLVRLFDVDDGAVLLDGVDVRELRYQSLRESTAVVPQDTVLFNDTLLHNVAFGRPQASVEEVESAAVAAKLGGAGGALERMPQGWNTLVGERGLKLSGGEKQRVAIARAFLRKPRLLICDEATSALDTATERGIMASLEELARGRTSVFVAHRLSTVQGCDKIYVLRDGKVAESGRHAELMGKRGVYYDMWQMQRAQEELESHLKSMSVDLEEDTTNGTAADVLHSMGVVLPSDDDEGGSSGTEEVVEPQSSMDRM